MQSGFHLLLNMAFLGEGSLIKISNGECFDYQDIYEINKNI